LIDIAGKEIHCSADRIIGISLLLNCFIPTTTILCGLRK